MMNPLSDEQEKIVNYLKDGKNVVVDACAGSGKSTTVLSAAKILGEKKVLQVTYNSSLRTEIKEKIKEYEIQNLTVHTYHSLAVRHYLPTCYTDSGIRQVLYNDLAPRSQPPKYDLIVIDETQDMSIIYYRLICKLLKDIVKVHREHRFQLLILGDWMQGLYEFKGSDIRFLTLAEEIWRTNPLLKTPEFMKCTMKMSYRITNQMRDFINDCMLGEPRLDSCRDGQKVTYIRNSQVFLENTVVFLINRLLETREATPGDIFILGASVKGPNSNIRKIENALVRNNIPCHVPIIENEKIEDERVIKGKVVFSTFHCVKGRQRKYVFVVGFDNGYLEYYARNLPRHTCPNTLYVGCTRATHGLYLLEIDQYSTDRPLEFLKKTHHQMREMPCLHFRGHPRSIFYEKEAITDGEVLDKPTHVTPTELIKFMSESVLEKITPILERIFKIEAPEGVIIEIPSIIETKLGTYEEVSDLNGIAVQSCYYDRLSDGNVLYEIINENIAIMKSGQHMFLRIIADELSEKITKPSEYLYLANIYIATQEKLYFKLKQIQNDEYNWLTSEVISQCLERLETVIGKNFIDITPLIEETIIYSGDNDAHCLIDEILSGYFGDKKFRFTARTDIITEDTVWELKCTSKLSLDHQLQLVIYAWLWRLAAPLDDLDAQLKQFKLFNVKTGELLVLDAELHELNEIMILLLDGKYRNNEPKSDDDFLLETQQDV